MSAVGVPLCLGPSFRTHCRFCYRLRFPFLPIPTLPFCRQQINIVGNLIYDVTWLWALCSTSSSIEHTIKEYLFKTKFPQVVRINANNKRCFERLWSDIAIFTHKTTTDCNLLTKNLTIILWSFRQTFPGTTTNMRDKQQNNNNR